MVRSTSTRTPPLSPLWRNLAIGAAVAVVVIVALILLQTPGTTPVPPPTAPGAPPATAALYVDPATGSDDNDGAEQTPLKTIQVALELAEPGTTINLAPGEYHEQQVTTVREGTADAPITIRGPENGKDPAGRHQATLYGTGRIMNIDHSYYTLEGFTIDGQEALKGKQFPTDVADATAFKNSVRADVADGRLIYIGSADDSKDITGVTIRNMFLTSAGGECVRLRNNAHDNTITQSVVQYCGLFGKVDEDAPNDRFQYHNGEGIYIGTSPKSDDQPMYENDTSHGNQVTDNTVHTFGSECFNIKENAYENVFENNDCAGNTESAEFNGSNVELRGHDNIVRNNTISQSAGFGVKIQSDEDTYDKGGNTVEDNRMSQIAVAAFQVGAKARQGPICGNQITGVAQLSDPEGDDDDAGKVADATQPC